MSLPDQAPSGAASRPGAARVLQVVASALVLLLCFFFLRRMNLSLVLDVLRQVEPRLVLAVMLLNVPALIGARALRWQALLRPLAHPGHAPRPFELFGLMLSAYAANSLLPARPGEALRVLQLHRRHHYPIGALVGVQLIEKVFEALAMGLLALPVALLAPVPWPLRGPLLLFAGLGVVGAWLSSWMAGQRDRFCSEVAAQPRSPWRRALALGCRALYQIADAAWHARAPQTWVTALLWSLVIVLLDVAMIALCLRAVAVQLPLLCWILLLLAINLSILVPVTPGQVGVLEAGAVLTLSLLGVGHHEALAFALLYHASHVLPVIALGFMGLFEKTPERTGA